LKRKCQPEPLTEAKRAKPAVPVEPEPFGLRVWHEPLCAPQQPQNSTSGDATPLVIDVIFMHGLGGSSRATWTHPNSEFWPTWLQEKKGLENIRISTFGYDANWDITKRSNALGIPDFASDLLMALKLHYTTVGNVCPPLILAEV
jgi:hypothetical protein